MARVLAGGGVVEVGTGRRVETAALVVAADLAGFPVRIVTSEPATTWRRAGAPILDLLDADSWPALLSGRTVRRDDVGGESRDRGSLAEVPTVEIVAAAKRLVELLPVPAAARVVVSAPFRGSYGLAAATLLPAWTGVTVVTADPWDAVGVAVRRRAVAVVGPPSTWERAASAFAARRRALRGRDARRVARGDAGRGARAARRKVGGRAYGLRGVCVGALAPAVSELLGIAGVVVTAVGDATTPPPGPLAPLRLAPGVADVRIDEEGRALVLRDAAAGADRDPRRWTALVGEAAARAGIEVTRVDVVDGPVDPWGWLPSHR